MTNRRRANRFDVPRTGEATLRLMHDVLIERATADAIEMLMDVPLKAGDVAIVELPSGHGSRAAVCVTVQSSAPVTPGDLRRHRLTARLTTGAGPGPHAVSQSHDISAARQHLPALGIAIRRVPVHLRDVSTSGCLLESLEPLPEGCVGILELPHDAEPNTEAIRICRVARVTGSPWPWRAGATFLSLAAPAEASVRNVVARFEILDELYSGRASFAR